MNHKQKRKLARRMRSKKETEAKISIWDSEAWIDRKIGKIFKNERKKK